MGHEGFERTMYGLFTERIQVRGGFIQDQYRGVAQKCPGDGNALPLSAGQGNVSKGLQFRIFHSGLYLCLVGVGPGDEQIGAQAFVEQVGVLGDQ